VVHATGFELRDQFPDSGPAWCELARDDLVVQFLSGETPWPGAPAMTGCLYIHPPSVTAVHDELRGTIDLEWSVEDRDWGATRARGEGSERLLPHVHRGHLTRERRSWPVRLAAESGTDGAPSPRVNARRRSIART
jgi:hypothetical protein